MTKGEIRRARKEARAGGRSFSGELTLDRDAGAVEFSETSQGRRALDRWARAYDALNGAPEGDSDR